MNEPEQERKLDVELVKDAPPPDLMHHFAGNSALVKLTALGLSLFLQRFPWRSALLMIAAVFGGTGKLPW